MEGNWSNFHQVLNRARWSPLAVSRQLILPIVETFVSAGACVDLVIDETLERRWGSKISKRGHFWVALDRDSRWDQHLDPEATAMAISCFLQGVGSRLPLPPEELRQTFAQLIHWLSL